MTDPSTRLRIAAELALGVVLAASMVGCIAEPAPTERVRPTPTPGPPSIRPASGTSGTFDGRIWTLNVVVEPKGEPTDVVIEWGLGSEAGPFDHVIAMAEDVVDAGQISIQTDDLPAEPPYCLRFTASNAFGSASTPARCMPALPSGALQPSTGTATPSPGPS